MTSPDLAATQDYTLGTTTPPVFRTAEPTSAVPATPAPPNAHPGSLVEMIRRRMWVTNRLAAIEAEKKVLAAEGSELDDLIVDAMIEAGIDTPPGVDGRTPYLYEQRYIAKRIDPDTGEPFTGEQVMEVMRAAGLGAMIAEGYNGNQLKAALVELIDNDEELPEALNTVVEIKGKHTLRSRAASVAKTKTAKTLAAARAARSATDQ